MSITSANATFLLGIADVFPVPQQLTQFAADDLFDTEAIDSAEVRMGVDGSLTAGFVFVPVKQTITLQADSPSCALFDAWWAAQQVAKDVFSAFGIVILPGLGTKWALTNGFLTSYKPIPDAKKLLEPRKFGITWEKVLAATT